MKRAGRLLVVSGPSGTGKGTICGRIIEEMEDVVLSVSMTTRPKRRGEVHGKSYFFVTREEFEHTIAQDGFLEHAQVYENYYGTPRHKVMEMLKDGKDVLLEIDTQGAMKIRKTYPDGVFIFILPPSIRELQRRLSGRGTDTEEVIRLRLGKAVSEIEQADCYDFIVVNDQLDQAVEEVKAIILAERDRVGEDIYEMIRQYKEEQ